VHQQSHPKKEFGRTINKVREHYPDGHHDLEHPSDASTYLRWRAFAHVGWSDCTYRANPKTRYDATSIDVTESTMAFTICYRLQYLRDRMSAYWTYVEAQNQSYARRQQQKSLNMREEFCVAQSKLERDQLCS